MNKKTEDRPVMTALYAAVAAFLTYTMIFGFRKAFTVTTFDGIGFGGLSFKTLMVVCQVIGYLLAKFYGIRYIAELDRMGRGKLIMMLTGIAWLAWLGFAIVPAPWSLVFLFFNGFPLGMLWGVVFSYIEGRRSTDFIGAALSVSFIFSSGFVKSVGGWLMQQFGTPEAWVPFLAGLLFAGPLLVFIWLMEKIPPPSPADEAERMHRHPMNAANRKALIIRFLPGFVISILIYSFATVFRDIRDNFSADMWQELGFIDKPSIFTKTEVPITLAILIVIGSLTLVRNSFRAFMLAHLAIGLGFVLTGLSSWLFMQGHIAPFTWMVGTGMGLYMVYIPFNSMFFERLIAGFRISGNVGFLIYLADSIGYVGSVGVLLSKEVFKLEAKWVPFFSQSTIWLSTVGLLLTIAGALYFKHQRKLTLAEEKAGLAT